MKDKDIDDILERAAWASPEVDSGLLGRVSASMGASLRPVRPLAPAWMLASALWLVGAVISIGIASLVGMEGIRRLTAVELLTIFPALAIFTWFAAVLSVAQMTPGSLRIIHPKMLLLVVLALWLSLDAALFHDYRMGAFVQQGMPCLRAGLVVAVPTGAASWLTLRRGFTVNASAAGLAAGTLAGLTGLAMLEFHCPNDRAMHIMVWHTAVVPISALAGALLAKLTDG